MAACVVPLRGGAAQSARCDSSNKGCDGSTPTRSSGPSYGLRAARSRNHGAVWDSSTDLPARHRPGTAELRVGIGSPQCDVTAARRQSRAATARNQRWQAGGGFQAAARAFCVTSSEAEDGVSRRGRARLLQRSDEHFPPHIWAGQALQSPPPAGQRLGRVCVASSKAPNRRALRAQSILHSPCAPGPHPPAPSARRRLSRARRHHGERGAPPAFAQAARCQSRSVH